LKETKAAGIVAFGSCMISSRSASAWSEWKTESQFKKKVIAEIENLVTTLPNDSISQDCLIVGGQLCFTERITKRR
jgi:hypothetical protein